MKQSVKLIVAMIFLFGQGVASAACNWTYPHCKPCAEKPGLIAEKIGVVCRSCGLTFCYTPRPGQASLPAMQGMDVSSSEGVLYIAPEDMRKSSGKTQSLFTGASNLNAVAQINPMVAVALALFEREQSVDHNIMKGSISAPGKMTLQTWRLFLEESTDEAKQLASMAPLSHGNHHVETRWEAVRLSANLISVTFSTQEIGGDGVIVKLGLLPTIRAVFSGKDAPRMESWTVEP